MKPLIFVSICLFSVLLFSCNDENIIEKTENNQSKNSYISNNTYSKEAKPDINTVQDYNPCVQYGNSCVTVNNLIHNDVDCGIINDLLSCYYRSCSPDYPKNPSYGTITNEGWYTNPPVYFYQDLTYYVNGDDDVDLGSIINSINSYRNNLATTFSGGVYRIGVILPTFNCDWRSYQTVRITYLVTY
ncbi:hypothetical protein V9L05_06645 [Bernardetia sp. Wsw4-3y2]|uniref:hypothetical protein n=1 Tax=unclassified Bernardetia TaxID=2647129 RepID=UPI0030CF26CB